MPVPGTLEWIKRWYVNRAFGICRNMASGPFGESEEEFREEMALCLALYHEAAEVFLRKFSRLSKEEINEIKKHLDKEAREVFGDKTWEAAKYLAANFKEIFREIESKI